MQSITQLNSEKVSSQRNAFDFFRHVDTWKMLFCFHHSCLCQCVIAKFLHREKCNPLWRPMQILFVFLVLLAVLFLGSELKVYFIIFCKF